MQLTVKTQVKSRIAGDGISARTCVSNASVVVSASGCLGPPCSNLPLSTPGWTMPSTLWAHLLDKGPASRSDLRTGLASVGLIASAPTDRTRTSVRILLHDT